MPWHLFTFGSAPFSILAGGVFRCFASAALISNGSFRSPQPAGRAGAGGAVGQKLGGRPNPTKQRRTRPKEYGSLINHSALIRSATSCEKCAMAIVMRHPQAIPSYKSFASEYNCLRIVTSLYLNRKSSIGIAHSFTNVLICRLQNHLKFLNLCIFYF